MYTRRQRFAAECLGTFGVVLFSAGAVCAGRFMRGGNPNEIGLLGVALAYGLAYGAMAMGTGQISGGHLNPAVTIGYWVTRKLNTFDFIGYCVAQLAGAVAAAYLLRFIIPEDAWRAAALGAPDLATGLTRTPGMLIEAVLTFFLVLVVFATSAASGGAGIGITGTMSAGLAVTLIVSAGVLFGGPFTGAAMNPARAFGPAVAAHHWANHAVYWVGPLAGGVLAAWLHDMLFSRTGPRTRPA